MGGEKPSCAKVRPYTVYQVCTGEEGYRGLGETVFPAAPSCRIFCWNVFLQEFVGELVDNLPVL